MRVVVRVRVCPVQVKDMCMRFAEMERKLGEIDRARAIFVYAAQMCDPRIVVTFWKVSWVRCGTRGARSAGADSWLLSFASASSLWPNFALRCVAWRGVDESTGRWRRHRPLPPAVRCVVCVRASN